MKTYHFLLLSLIVVFTSCKKDEILTDKIDFTTEDIGSIIKMNFLEAYGGILREKEYIYNLSKNHLYSAKVDENFSEEVLGQNNSYNMTISGNYKNDYGKSLMVYNDRFISFWGQDSKCKASLGKYEIETELITNINIAGNVSDKEFVFAIDALRNITFTKGLNKIQKIEGNIRFITGLCKFDYDENLLTPNIEFFAKLFLYNQQVLGDSIELNGKIIQEQSKWIFISVDGDRIPL